MTEPDEITVTLPRGRQYQSVAQLVLGGLALRHELTIETLEDLQIALGAILDRAGSDGDVTVTMSLHDGMLEARVGPIDLDGELGRVDDGSGLSLARLLRAVVDDVEVDGDWVQMRKKVRSGG